MAKVCRFTDENDEAFKPVHAAYEGRWIEFIPEPQREIDKEFLMPLFENVFSDISKRDGSDWKN